MTAAANDQGIAHLGDYFSQSLKDRDPDLYASMQDELHRQQHEIELIASENIVSRAVLEAQGSVLTNKYAEGYPGKRYYCLLYTSPSPRDRTRSRMPSSA